MRRRALLQTAAGVVCTLPIAGCLDVTSNDDPGGSGDPDDSGSDPETWRDVEPLDSGYVTFEAGSFEASAADPPAVGESLDGNAAWNLVTETAWSLRDASFQLALETHLVEGDAEIYWDWTLWRDADADVVYQRQEIERAGEDDQVVREYNDGTRYVAGGTDGPEYYHVPDPHWHRDRVDSHLLMPFFQLATFEVLETVSVDGTEMRLVRHTDAHPDKVEIESADFFVGTDGIVRNADAEYGTADGTPTDERYAVDGAVEITAGTPTIDEPEWTDEALEEEREPSEGPA